MKIFNNECEYADLNRERKMKCSQAKEDYLNMKIHEITGKYKGHHGKCGCIIDESGNIIMKTKDILEPWGRFIKELYDDPKRKKISILFEVDLSGPDILELEVEQAVKQSKVGKATGLDNISCEMLKTLGQDGISVLCKLFNEVCNQGVLPEEMCQLVFVPLPKKPGTLLCEEHRTISLMSHLTKVLLKVLATHIK